MASLGWAFDCGDQQTQTADRDGEEKTVEFTLIYYPPRVTAQRFWILSFLRWPGECVRPQARLQQRAPRRQLR